MDPEKRPDRFLEFAEKLFLVREDVIFIMAGNGSMWAALKEKICHLKCRDNFRLLGEIYPATIVYQIRIYCIFLLIQKEYLCVF
nr:hypothetical protein [Streptococcus pneumoniae]